MGIADILYCWRNYLVRKDGEKPLRVSHLPLSYDYPKYERMDCKCSLGVLTLLP